jgi:glycosyltransferase involved in cell wall biosynthesis
MKIIALMPVKNEGWILKTTIPQLKKFADEILCLDAGSTDDTLSYLQSAGVSVRQQTEKKTNYSSWRQELLQWGREQGGTHFIWLDADEAFTTNFLGTETSDKKSQIPFRQRLAAMKPREKFALQWLCLWKSPFTYRDDTSVWSNLYKDFIICDDGKVGFDNTVLHEGRTPGPNANPDGSGAWTKIPLEEGGVLHFQFVPFQRFQVKQAYQRVRELTMKNGSARRLNRKYAETLDNPEARTKPVPQSWLAGISSIDGLTNVTENWYRDGIFEYFKKNGILYYEALQIWHIPEFKKMFIEQIHREPRIKTYPKIVIQTKKIMDRIRKGI